MSFQRQRRDTTTCGIKGLICHGKEGMDAEDYKKRLSLEPPVREGLRRKKSQRAVVHLHLWIAYLCKCSNIKPLVDDGVCVEKPLPDELFQP